MRKLLQSLRHLVLAGRGESGGGTVLRRLPGIAHGYGGLALMRYDQRHGMPRMLPNFRQPDTRGGKEPLMLLFDESKIFEKAIGEEATAVLAKVLERQDESRKEGLATKEDLYQLEIKMAKEFGQVRNEIGQVKVDIIKWMVSLMFAQIGLVTGVIVLVFRLMLR
jgi:hypothetical protein